MVNYTLMQKCTSNLANDIRAFHEKGSELADVTLVCREPGTDKEARFPTHRVILAARSDVLGMILQQKNSREEATKEVMIEDTDPGTLKRFLR